ncbi:hypothetical protein FMEAI12_5210020 [Parafrankia sp. Ea1.12]|uniref:hypothetical protein n=1 Tax=Parafrankia sp. Ea1.12 TaxID=573499 RepID=UPI000DA4E3C9|nr:hypothetical protein [Parafrankia sp. Ea1.12]SQD99308.1 hypothetical protein FMEAI12_5210020 [Parafrankia sp. Ea1.12]
MVDGTDDVWAGDAGTDGTDSVPIDRTTPDTTQDAEPDAAQDAEAPGRGSRPTARLVAWSRDVDRAEALVAVSIVIAAVVALVGSFRFQTKPDAEGDHYQSGYEAALVDLRNAPIGEEQDLSTDEDRAPPAAAISRRRRTGASGWHPAPIGCCSRAAGSRTGMARRW